MGDSWASRAVLAASAGLLTAAVAFAAPAQADPADDTFLGALGNAGVGIDNPADATALGQSVCPMISENSGSLGSVVSAVSNATSPFTGRPGVSPETAELFTEIAVEVYCPQMMSQIANGQTPNLDIPGLTGGTSGIPGLGGGIPGVPGGIPGIPQIPGR